MALTRRGRVAILLGVPTVLFGGLALAGYLYLVSVGVWGSSDPGRPVAVTIPTGAATETIGRILEEKGVIKSATGFRIAVALDDDGLEDLQAGDYRIPTGLTAREALNALLEQGPAGDEFVMVTFPEGLWLKDFARILERKTHLDGDKFLGVLESGRVRPDFMPPGETNMEGMLFPASYQVIERDTERDVARRLVEEMEKQMRKQGVFERAEALGLSPYEAVTVASMIEAEAKVDEERPMIARVILNRIDEGMTLGIDATVYYAIGKRKPDLTVSELDVDSPYNTRKVAGIPPTPIGAPGADSLEAAVKPADGSWLYYVLNDCQGHHAFSESYDEFLQNKAVYEGLEC